MKTMSAHIETIDAARELLDRVEDAFHADGSARTGLRAGAPSATAFEHAKGKPFAFQALYGVVVQA